jgi:hypothetical protein
MVVLMADKGARQVLDLSDHEHIPHRLRQSAARPGRELPVEVGEGRPALLFVAKWP